MNDGRGRWRRGRRRGEVRLDSGRIVDECLHGVCVVGHWVDGGRTWNGGRKGRRRGRKGFLEGNS